MARLDDATTPPSAVIRSSSTAGPAAVVCEVRRLINTPTARARLNLDTHLDTLDLLSRTLLVKETLEDADLADIFGTLDKGTGIDHPAPEPKIGRAHV